MSIFFKNFIFISYSFISTLIEDKFYRQSKLIDKNSNFHKKGFQLFSLLRKAELPINTPEYYGINPYKRKIVLKDDQIKNIIKIIFIDNNIAKKISKLTGFNYNIDHITAYETYHIPKDQEGKSWYANLWHKDGPYSKNNIKVVIPLSDIGDNSGGMKIVSSDKSSKYLPASGIENDFEPEIIFKSKAFENILVFCPHLCLHRAGNPIANKTRKQLIFQINPSLKWTISNNLTINQTLIEPKFPIIYNLFKKNNKKTELFNS